MALVPLTSPYSLKNASFSVAQDDFTAAISQVQFDPSTSSSTWRGIGGNVVRDTNAAEWTATIGYAQDLAAGGFARWLHDHEGETVTATFEPVDDGPTVTATLVISPGTIGGTADGNTVTASVQLAVVGRPEFSEV